MAHGDAKASLALAIVHSGRSTATATWATSRTRLTIAAELGALSVAESPSIWVMIELCERSSAVPAAWPSCSSSSSSGFKRSRRPPTPPKRALRPRAPSRRRSRWSTRVMRRSTPWTTPATSWSGTVPGAWSCAGPTAPAPDRRRRAPHRGAGRDFWVRFSIDGWANGPGIDHRVFVYPAETGGGYVVEVRRSDETVTCRNRTYEDLGPTLVGTVSSIRFRFVCMGGRQPFRTRLLSHDGDEVPNLRFTPVITPA